MVLPLILEVLARWDTGVCPEVVWREESTCTAEVWIPHWELGRLSVLHAGVEMGESPTGGVVGQEWEAALVSFRVAGLLMLHLTFKLGGAVSFILFLTAKVTAATVSSDLLNPKGSETLNFRGLLRTCLVSRTTTTLYSPGSTMSKPN